MGEKYFSTEFDVYCEEYGIIHEFSIPRKRASWKKEYDTLRNDKFYVNAFWNFI